MVKKKIEPSSAPVAEALPAISCPGCKSKISADGKTLHEKSGYLDELIETDIGVDEVEKKIEKMQNTVKAHEATIADLRTQLEAANKKPSQEKEKPGVVQKQRSGDGNTKPKPASWWD